MARRSTAALLVALWFSLSAVELLQYADFANHSLAYSAKGSDARDLGRSARVVDNATENRSPRIEGADDPGFAVSPSRKGRSLQPYGRNVRAAQAQNAPENNRKIYELHGILRI